LRRLTTPYQVTRGEIGELRGGNLGDIALQAWDIELVENSLLACQPSPTGDILLVFLPSEDVDIGLVLDDVSVWDDKFRQDSNVFDRRGRGSQR
jgi:hypothetical protein